MDVIERRAIRAILISPGQEVLLLRIRPPEGGESFWVTPGGGMEPGETIESGLRRELSEELGLAQFEIDAVELRGLQEFRWWPVAELSRVPERLTPLSLAEILARYLAQGPPREPLDVEILVD